MKTIRRKRRTNKIEREKVRKEGNHYLPAPMRRGWMVKSSQEMIRVRSVSASTPQIGPHAAVLSTSPQTSTRSGDKFAVQRNLTLTPTRLLPFGGRATCAGSNTTSCGSAHPRTKRSSFSAFPLMLVSVKSAWYAVPSLSSLLAPSPWLNETTCLSHSMNVPASSIFFLSSCLFSCSSCGCSRKRSK